MPWDHQDLGDQQEQFFVRNELPPLDPSGPTRERRVCWEDGVATACEELTEAIRRGAWLDALRMIQENEQTVNISSSSTGNTGLVFEPGEIPCTIRAIKETATCKGSLEPGWAIRAINGHNMAMLDRDGVFAAVKAFPENDLSTVSVRRQTLGGSGGASSAGNGLSYLLSLVCSMCPRPSPPPPPHHTRASVLHTRARVFRCLHTYWSFVRWPGLCRWPAVHGNEDL